MKSGKSSPSGSGGTGGSNDASKDPVMGMTEALERADVIVNEDVEELSEKEKNAKNDVEALLMHVVQAFYPDIYTVVVEALIEHGLLKDSSRHVLDADTEEGRRRAEEAEKKQERAEAEAARLEKLGITVSDDVMGRNGDSDDDDGPDPDTIAKHRNPLAGYLGLTARQTRRYLSQLFNDGLVSRWEGFDPERMNAKTAFWYINHRHVYKVIKARMFALQKVVDEQAANARAMTKERLYECKRCRKGYDGATVASLFIADGTRAKCTYSTWDGPCGGRIEEIKGVGGRVNKAHEMRRNFMEKFKSQMMDRPEGKGIMSYLNLHAPNDVPMILASSIVTRNRKKFDIAKKLVAGEHVGKVRDGFIERSGKKDPNAKLKKEMAPWMKFSAVTGKKTSKARRDEAERKRKRAEIAAENGTTAFEEETQQSAAEKAAISKEEAKRAYIQQQLKRMRGEVA